MIFLVVANLETTFNTLVWFGKDWSLANFTILLSVWQRYP